MSVRIPVADHTLHTYIHAGDFYSVEVLRLDKIKGTLIIFFQDRRHSFPVLLRMWKTQLVREGKGVLVELETSIVLFTPPSSAKKQPPVLH